MKNLLVLLALLAVTACTTNSIQDSNQTTNVVPTYMTKDEVLAEIANPSLEIKADFDDAAYKERLLSLVPLTDLIKNEKSFKKSTVQIKAVSINDLPTDVDLRSQDTPARNQGQEGLCTAFGLTATQEATHCAVNKQCNLDLSERHRWSMYKVYNADSALGTIGRPVAPESVCPYSNSNCPANVQSYAKYQIGKMYKLQSKEEVLSALANGKHVYFWGSVPKQMTTCSKTITSPVMEPNAGHAYKISGFFDKTNPILIMKNSWGPTCGDSGFQYMKFNVFDKNGYWGAAMMDSASILDKVPSLPVCKTVCEWVKTGRTFFSYRKQCVKRCE